VRKRMNSSPSNPSITVVHYADPVCPWSWALEPVLRRLKEVYGTSLEIDYRMGGAIDTIDNWMKNHGLDYDGAIWVHKVLTAKTGVPFDPDFLRKTAIKSSYPACLTVKASQLQDLGKAERYLRRMLETFLVRAEPYSQELAFRIGGEVGLDVERLKRDASSKDVEKLFDEDRRRMEKDGASFLSVIIESKKGEKRETLTEIFTSPPFEGTIDRMAQGLKKRSVSDILEYFSKYPRDLIPTHEVAEVFGIGDDEAARRLSDLARADALQKLEHDAGDFWTGRLVHSPPF